MPKALLKAVGDFILLQVKFCWWEVIQIGLISIFFSPDVVLHRGKCELKLKTTIIFAWIYKHCDLSLILILHTLWK